MFSLLRNLSRMPGRPARSSVRLGVEALEDRTVPATLGSLVPARDGVVFAILSADGSLWEYNPQINPSGPADSHWAEITSANVAQISVTQNSAGDPVVFAILADNSLWEYNPQLGPANPIDQHWARITSAGAFQINATQNSAGDPVVFAGITADSSLWEYNPQFGSSGPLDSHWGEVTTAATNQLLVTRNSAGDPVLVVTLAQDYSLWEYNPQFYPNGPSGSHWNELTTATVGPVDVTHNSAGDPVVFAGVGGPNPSGSLWEYNPQYLPGNPVNLHWYEISPASAESLSATQNSTGDPVVFATIAADGSLWEYNPQYLPSNPVNLHWYEITTAQIGQFSATQNVAGDPVFFGFLGNLTLGQQLWEYNPQFSPGNSVDLHWVRLTTNLAQTFDPISLAQNSAGDTVVFALVGPDQELWEYNPQFGPNGPVDQHWVQLTSAGVFQMAAPGSTTTLNYGC
jgi:hypothetical protein